MKDQLFVPLARLEIWPFSQFLFILGNVISDFSFFFFFNLKCRKTFKGEEWLHEGSIICPSCTVGNLTFSQFLFILANVISHFFFFLIWNVEKLLKAEEWLHEGSIICPSCTIGNLTFFTSFYSYFSFWVAVHYVISHTVFP